MVRRLLLPALGLAFFLTEAAAAQTLPTAPAVTATARKSARTGRTLTARERRAAEAAAKAAAANKTVAMATPAATTQPGWSGWSNDPVVLPQDETLYHPRTNLSAAPGMPVNQVGHGVTTDYDGHPLRRTAPVTASGTTLPTQR